MSQLKATRRGLLTMGLGISAAPLLPAARADAHQHQPDFSDCRNDVDVVIAAVAHEFGVTRSDLLGPSREHHVVRPRQIGMYLAWAMTGRSLPELGRHFGGRDHTTVLHAARKIAAQMRADAAVAGVVEKAAAQCVAPMRRLGTKLSAIPMNTTRWAHRLSSTDGPTPWTVVG